MDLSAILNFPPMPSLIASLKTPRTRFSSQSIENQKFYIVLYIKWVGSRYKGLCLEPEAFDQFLATLLARKCMPNVRVLALVVAEIIKLKNSHFDGGHLGFERHS